MHLRALTLTLLLAGGAAYPLAGQAPSPEAVSITHVTVVDVAAGKKLPDQTVVVQGERTLAVAAFDFANPLEGRVVDATVGASSSSAADEVNCPEHFGAPYGQTHRHRRRRR